VDSLIFVPTAASVLCTVLHTPQHSSGDRSSIYLNPCDDSVGHQIADNMMNVTIITYSVEMCDPQQPCSCSVSSDLSLNLHVLKVCTVSFYRLRQLHCIRKSLDNESTATLVHAFVASCVDYCNAVYVISPQTITNRLQG